MKEKYLYFRREPTDTSAISKDHAACFPTSSLMGIVPTSRTEVTLYFKSMLRGSGNEGAADAVANLDNNDSVILNVGTEKQIEAIRAIIEAISNVNSPAMIVVANNDSGGTEYLTGSTITSCGSINITTAYTN